MNSDEPTDQVLLRSKNLNNAKYLILKIWHYDCLQNGALTKGVLSCTLLLIFSGLK